MINLCKKTISRKVVLSIFILFFALVTCALTAPLNARHNFQNTTTTANSEEKAKGLMKRQKLLGFQENKGQMADEKGNLIPDVLFKAEAPRLNIWVTKTGLTYQFFTIDKKLLTNADGSPKLKLNGEQEQEKEKTIRWHRIDMVLKSATIKKENTVTEGDVTQGAVDYYLEHCPDGVFDVKTYTKITVKEIYKGIDWMLYTSKEGGIKHDFVVHPGADPGQIKLIYEGSGKFKATDNQIHFSNELGELTEGKLLCYQGNESNAITSKYHFKENNNIIYAGLLSNAIEKSSIIEKLAEENNQVFSYEVELDFGRYNKNKTLIVDPKLVWGTFFGGSGADGSMALDTDNSGNVFVAGYTESINFPTRDAGTFYQGAVIGNYDAFILKFSNAGVLNWATYYGGYLFDFVNSATVDVAGNILVTGYTESLDFPVQNAVGAYFQGVKTGNIMRPAEKHDCFILKFSNAGNRLWATYYGGTQNEYATAITTDALGNIFVAGTTSSSSDFPLKDAGTYFNNVLSGSSDIFILKFSNSNALLWSTFYGGSESSDLINSICTDQSGNLLMTGAAFSPSFPTLGAIGYYNQSAIAGNSDAILLKFSNTGTLLWSTFYGGTGRDDAYAIAVDANDNFFVSGSTESPSLVLQNSGTYFDNTLGGSQDVFILRFNNTGNLTWGTLFGGSNLDTQYALKSNDRLAIDACGNAYISFETASTDIFTVSCGEEYKSAHKGGTWDQFICRFTNQGVLLWSTYIGGIAQDFRSPIGVDNANNLFFSGEWTNRGTGMMNNFSTPLLNPGAGAYYDEVFHGGFDDAFMLKFSPITPTYNSSHINSTSCSPCNGSATVTVNCGISNYSYVWSNGTTAIDVASPTNTITGLCPGNYTVTTTSNCSQIRTATFTITGATCGGITASVNSATMCSGSTPCPILTATGASGTSPYSYNWSSGATTQSINPCPSATTNYTVTVKDNTGASATSTAIVTVNPAVTTGVTTTDILCSGASTGSATATGAGGTSPYTYSWSTGVTATGTSSTIPNLPANTYSVTVTDKNGCSTSKSVILNSPTPLLGQFTKGTVNCTSCGCQDWILVNAVGGTPPYSYLWPDAYTNRYKNKICQGNYLINVKDKNGCSVDINITSP